MTTLDKDEISQRTVSAPSKGADSIVPPRPLTVWIWLCAGLNLAGWVLSALGQLNARSYIIVLLAGAVAFLGWRFYDKPGRRARLRLQKWIHRFKRPFPLAFLILSVMALLGGAIYAPTNYDGLAYRLPRVLHWLAAGQWHWIHTDFPRLNNRACGIEWVSAPLMAIFKTDRLLFLVNFIPYLFLPGLTFGVLTRSGVRRRVAWHWMWIAPTGYCFLLQAASIGNDAFCAPFVLAAIYFAFRARESGRVQYLFTSILSAALMTSPKTSSLPLLLPWGIAILPALKLSFQRPLATAGVCVVACFASFLPSAAANQHFDHDWTGLKAEGDQTHGSTPIRLGINVVYVALSNLTPPLFPQAEKWNAFVRQEVPPNLSLKLHGSFSESGPPEMRAEQMQVEESAGFGFGPSILAAASALAALILCGKSYFNFRIRSFDNACQAGVILTPWVSLFALLSQSEVAPIARIMAPYYILLLPIILRAPCHDQVVRKTWWRASALVVFALAAVPLIASPARPLFPVGALLAKVHQHPNSKLAARIEEVYSVYRDRNHAFAPALAILPPDTKTLGLITYDDPEETLWQPFGSRNIVCVKPDDTAIWLKAQGVQYILARSTLFGNRFPDFDAWAKPMNAAVVREIKLNLRADTGPLAWDLIKLN